MNAGDVANVVHQPSADSEGESATTLAAAWQRRHIGIKESSWEVLERKAPVRPCLNLGVCVCHGSGLHFRKIKQNLANYLKDLSAKPSFEKALLSGLVVLHWHLRDDPCTAGDAPPPLPCKHFWTHIGMMYLKPWRITLVHLNIADDSPAPDLYGDSAPAPRLALQFAQEDEGIDADTLLWFLLSLESNLQQCIMVEVWVLSSRATAMPVLSRVMADKLTEPARCVWRGLAIERSRRRRRTQAAHEILGNSPARARNKLRRQTSNMDREDPPADGIEAEPERVSDDDDDSDVLTVYEEPTDEHDLEGSDDAHLEVDVANSFLEDQLRQLSQNVPEREDPDPPASSAAPPDALPQLRLDHPGKWGPYGFSLKHPHQQGKHGGYQVNCPFHRRNEVTGCKKFVALEAWNDAAKKKALTLARWWAVQSQYFETQADHLKRSDMVWASCPTLQELEAMKPTEKPATKPLSDIQLQLRPQTSAASSQSLPPRALPKSVAAQQVGGAQGSSGSASMTERDEPPRNSTCSSGSSSSRSSSSASSHSSMSQDSS